MVSRSPHRLHEVLAQNLLEFTDDLKGLIFMVFFDSFFLQRHWICHSSVQTEQSKLISILFINEER